MHNQTAYGSFQVTSLGVACLFMASCASDDEVFHYYCLSVCHSLGFLTAGLVGSMLISDVQMWFLVSLQCIPLFGAEKLRKYLPRTIVREANVFF